MAMAGVYRTSILRGREGSGIWRKEKGGKRNEKKRERGK
jgi:hypothetical protein